MKRIRETKREEAGLSLVSVLLSLTLGMLILAGAVQWYQVLKKNVLKQQAIRQNLEISRTSLQFLMQDVHASGYLGYRTFDDNAVLRSQIVDTQSPYKFLKIDRAVFGFQLSPGQCQHRLPPRPSTIFKENSEVLILYHIPRKYTRIVHDMQNPEDPLSIEGVNSFQQGSIVLISDGVQSDLFAVSKKPEDSPGKIAHAASSNFNNRATLSKVYKRGAELVELQMIAYYLGKPPREAMRDSQSNSYSLYRDDLVHGAREIVTGILDFQVQYGVYESGRGVVYRKSQNISKEQWISVRSVRVRIEILKSDHIPSTITIPSTIWEYNFAIPNRNRRNFNSGADIT